MPNNNCCCCCCCCRLLLVVACRLFFAVGCWLLESFYLCIACANLPTYENFHPWRLTADSWRLTALLQRCRALHDWSTNPLFSISTGFSRKGLRPPMKGDLQFGQGYETGFPIKWNKTGSKKKWDFPFKMAISLDNQVSNYFQTGYTVDGRNPANQFRLVVIYQFSLVVIYKVVYIPGGAGYLPSTLWNWGRHCQKESNSHKSTILIATSSSWCNMQTSFCAQERLMRWGSRV